MAILNNLTNLSIFKSPCILIVMRGDFLFFFVFFI
nr:MAG TPA: hypothetical protein [Caudoviricetes sp.]